MNTRMQKDKKVRPHWMPLCFRQILREQNTSAAYLNNGNGSILFPRLP